VCISLLYPFAMHTYSSHVCVPPHPCTLFLPHEISILPMRTHPSLSTHVRLLLPPHALSFPHMRISPPLFSACITHAHPLNPSPMYTSLRFLSLHFLAYLHCFSSYDCHSYAPSWSI
jgi:hypothetical protein